MSEQTEAERAVEYLAGFGITATRIATITEWQFLNDDGFWVGVFTDLPEQSARDNAKYYGTNRVRSREVTYAEWEES